MRSTIRCCISCILPCGALDVVRIVHATGRVEEIAGTVTAAQIMKAYPKHILKRPTSRSHADVDSPAAAVVPRIVVVPPEAELRRGKIYFLVPVSSSSPEKPRSKKPSSATHRRRRKDPSNPTPPSQNNSTTSAADLLMSDRYLSEILSEKVSTPRDRRRGRVGVWRPNLESIHETLSDE